jgi:FeS assembly SUF system protein
MTNKLNNDTSAQQDNFVADFLNIKETESELPSSTSVGEGASITDMVLEQQIIDALRGVYDPEIPINIYDLGLIYGIDIDENKVVNIEMTLTTPGCPVAQTFPGTVECAVKCVDSVEDVHVELVWDPPWTKDRMTEDALLSLGLL